MSFRPRPATTASLVDVTDGHTARLERVLFAGMGNAPSRPLAIQFKAAATPYKELSQQVTDVGACVPRTFDPDYCAYDSFYFMGVTVVSALSGALMTRSVDTLVAVGTAIKQGMGDALIARGDNTAAVQRNSEYYADADKARPPPSDAVDKFQRDMTTFAKGVPYLFYRVFKNMANRATTSSTVSDEVTNALLRIGQRAGEELELLGDKRNEREMATKVLKQYFEGQAEADSMMQRAMAGLEEVGATMIDLVVALMTMITEPFLYAARAYRDGIETGGYERFGDLASLKGGATPVVLGSRLAPLPMLLQPVVGGNHATYGGLHLALPTRPRAHDCELLPYERAARPPGHGAVREHRHICAHVPDRHRQRRQSAAANGAPRLGAVF